MDGYASVYACVCVCACLFASDRVLEDVAFVSQEPPAYAGLAVKRMVLYSHVPTMLIKKK